MDVLDLLYMLHVNFSEKIEQNFMPALSVIIGLVTRD